jgi:hypothetical protein
MTEVPTPWPKALCQCRDWVSENLGVYVEGYHLQNQGGEVFGHIYFAGSEQALFPYIVEPGVGVLYCEWVQQRYQKQGFGKGLFEAFLSDMAAENAKGVLVEATDIEGQMHYSHYTSRGFEVVHEAGHHKLLYLPLSQEKVSYRRRENTIQPRRVHPVEILLFRGFHCPYEVSSQVLVQQVALEFGDQVTLQEVWTTPDTLEKYGVVSGIFINGKQKLTGGDSEVAVRHAILEEL